MLAELNEKLVRGGGLRIIGRLYRGPRHITAKFPVRRPEDLRNRAFRAVVRAILGVNTSGIEGTHSLVSRALRRGAERRLAYGEVVRGSVQVEFSRKDEDGTELDETPDEDEEEAP